MEMTYKNFDETPEKAIFSPATAFAWAGFS
jgi:hypothetical protein